MSDLHKLRNDFLLHMHFIITLFPLYPSATSFQSVGSLTAVKLRPAPVSGENCHSRQIIDKSFNPEETATPQMGTFSTKSCKLSLFVSSFSHAENATIVSSG